MVAVEPSMSSSISVTNVHHTIFPRRKPRQVWRRAVVVVTGMFITVSLLIWLLYNNDDNQPAMST